MAAYVVSGAGADKVNGVYVRTGAKSGGAPVFQHEVHGAVWLACDGTTWRIAGKADDSPGPDLSGDQDYYSVYAPNESLPPTFGWESAEAGVAPLPCFEGVAQATLLHIQY